MVSVRLVLAALLVGGAGLGAQSPSLAPSSASSSRPLPDDPLYPEAVIRGLSTAVPGLSVYRDHLPQPVVDGGYYTKTAENRPLIGRLPIEGAFVVGAFSGFGVMAAAGAGELAAQIITGKPLPDYASAFSLDRYQDPAYLNEISVLTTTGQI